MSENSAMKAKTQRKAITLDTKLQILDQLAAGQGPSAVGKKFSLNEATVRSIKRNEIAIRQSVSTGTALSAKTSSYSRDAVKEKMENVLTVWIENKSQQRIPVDGNTIKQTALTIYKRLKEDVDTSSTTKQPEFVASTGWMTGFLKRHDLHNIKIKRKSDEENGVCWKKRCARTYVAKSQTLDDCGDIFNENEEKDAPIFTATKIKKGLDLAENLSKYIEQHDPDKERVVKFQRDLKSLMAPYREIYNVACHAIKHNL